MPQLLLSTTYFGPVQWYQKLHRHGDCLIEANETFQKQTYRNRCVIATTAGRQVLSIPVEHGASATATLIKDLRISDHGNWRHLHWKALESAYGDSPFFQYYADDLRPFFEKRWTFLFDFNLEITQCLCQLLDVQAELVPTTSFIHPSDAEKQGFLDFREAIRPKHAPADDAFQVRPYYQVYAAKNGFMANLSVLDLLFNMGPEGIIYL